MSTDTSTLDDVASSTDLVIQTSVHSCGTAYVPRYSTVARCVLAVVMVGLPGVLGLVAGMHSAWSAPTAYVVPWLLMLVAILYAPPALRPPKDPIAALVDDVRQGRLEVADAMRLIGVVHERRTR